jgi:tRNA (guanine37-N1)-methyltransferase
MSREYPDRPIVGIGVAVLRPGDGVPEVLLSGDHAKIARWRRQQSLGRTWLRRPDLLARMDLSRQDRALLAEFIARQVSSPDSP